MKTGGGPNAPFMLLVNNRMDISFTYVWPPVSLQLLSGPDFVCDLLNEG